MVVECEWNMDKCLREELASTVQIRIYSYNDRIAGGVVTSIQDKREIPFCGLDQAVLIIEELLDRNRQMAPDYRYMRGCAGCRGWLDNQVSRQSSGRRQNFLVRVYGRQNRSLQGELRTGDKRCCFRSGMELMRLIHQCLQKKNENIITAAGGR